MRITLDLNYLLRRTCDHSDDCPRTWVAWCPELDVMSQGPGPMGALWMVREAVRMCVDDAITRGKHPFRDLAGPVEDEDWSLYQDYLTRFADEETENRWLRCYDVSRLSEHVDVLFAHNRMVVETFGRSCLISDEFYNELWYKHGGMMDVTATVEMTYRMDADEPDPEAWIRRNYGHSVGRIVSVKKPG